MQASESHSGLRLKQCVAASRARTDCDRVRFLLCQVAPRSLATAPRPARRKTDACRRASSALGSPRDGSQHNSDAEGPRRPPAAPPPSRLPHDSRRGEHCPGTPHDTTPPPRTAETRHETGCSSSYIIVALTERSPRQRTKSARFHAARNGAAPPLHRRARRRPGDLSASAHGAPEEPRRSALERQGARRRAVHGLSLIHI